MRTTDVIYALLICHVRATCPVNLILLYLIILTMFHELMKIFSNFHTIVKSYTNKEFEQLYDSNFRSMLLVTTASVDCGLTVVES
jgi:hypothetical protein